MKLSKQDIGVWVKCSDELPMKEDIFLVKVYSSPSIMYFNGKRFESEEYRNPVEWLKPIEQVYVLTESDLEDILMAHIDDIDSPSVKTFIQSITNQQ